MVFVDKLHQTDDALRPEYGVLSRICQRRPNMVSFRDMAQQRQNMVMLSRNGPATVNVVYFEGSASNGMWCAFENGLATERRVLRRRNMVCLEGSASNDGMWCAVENGLATCDDLKVWCDQESVGPQILVIDHGSHGVAVCAALQNPRLVFFSTRALSLSTVEWLLPCML